MTGQTKPKRVLLTIILGTLFIAGLLLYWWYQDDISAHGRLYPSKSKMCAQFAKSYLRTTREQENIGDFGGDVWQRAIAIESEIHNLCQMELTDEALEGYTPSNIQRYLNVYRNQ